MTSREPYERTDSLSCFIFRAPIPIAHDLAMVEVYYKLGIRHMLMCYNVKTPVGDGCQELTDGGLSRLGANLVKEMNRVGMLVDVAHTGYRTSMDVFDASSEPVIISHANARALCDHTRNVRDDQIKACAASGGVVGIIAFGPVLGDDGKSPCRSSDPTYSVRRGSGRSPARRPRPRSDLRPVGFESDHVEPPFPSASNTRHSTRRNGSHHRGLLRDGFSEADTRGILGGNWLTVAEKV